MVDGAKFWFSSQRLPFFSSFGCWKLIQNLPLCGVNVISEMCFFANLSVVHEFLKKNIIRKSVRNSYTVLNLMTCQIVDYGCPMKARSNIIQICWPESAASRSLNFGMLEQHSEQRFCHDVSVVDVFNQKVQTKIKAIIEKKISQLIVLGISILVNSNIRCFKKSHLYF